MSEKPDALRKAVDAIIVAAEDGFDLVEIMQVLADDITCPERIVPEVCDALDCLLED